MPQGEEDLRNLLSLSWNKLPKTFLTTRYLRNLQNGGIFVRTTKDELKLPEIKYHQLNWICMNCNLKYTTLSKNICWKIWIIL
jgi:Tfp pilus assembly protein PilZ